MLQSFENSTKTPGKLGFNFDIVIVLIDLANISTIEKSKLKIDVKFNNNNIQITSSRINVDEFKPGRSFEFQERPSILKDKLFKTPLEFQIHYDNQFIGNCLFLWPAEFINCIEGCGRELTRCDEADIMQNNQKVGRMEMISRLQIKCHEYEESQSVKPKANCCNPDENDLNPNDVMFVVGQTKGSISCSDVRVIPGSSSGSFPHATCLDLSEFRHVHGKTLSSTNILDTINAKCCKKKESPNLYADMMENLFDEANELPFTCKKNKPELLLNQSSCEQQTRLMCCTSETRFSTCSSSDSSQPHCCISDENDSEVKSVTIIKEKPIRRYCSLCHDDITWLPRFAACPKCGFRPTAYNVEENSYDHTLTANKILQEYANYPAKGKKSDICEQKCRCTCKDGKLCAHCRIKKVCEDIFQRPHSGEGDCGKCEAKSSDLYNICKTNSRQCRPYLAKCFQDLKELFEMNEAKKIAKNDKNVLTKMSTNIRSSTVTDFQNRKHKEKVKNSEFSHNHEKSEKLQKCALKTFQKDKKGTKM